MLYLLTALKEGKDWSVQGAASELNVAKSTAHRLLVALVRNGYAQQDPRRRYVYQDPSIGESAVPLDLAKLKPVIDESLTRIVEKVGETAHFEILQGDHVNFFSGNEYSEKTLQVGIRTGLLMPAFTSAGGRAILATMSNSVVESMHEDGLPRWRTAKINSMQSLKRNLAKVRRDGYAVSSHETEAGVCSVGVALTSGEFRSAFAVAMPAVRFDRNLLPKLVVSLNDEVATLKRALQI